MGRNQLVYSLRKDKRVVVYEKTHAKDLTEKHIDCSIDLAVMDVSFISIKKIFNHLLEIIKEKAEWVILIKPQFEGEKEFVEKGRLVTDRENHIKILEKVFEYFHDARVTPHEVIPSPIRGMKGNIEYPMHLNSKKKARISLNAASIVEEAFGQNS